MLDTEEVVTWHLPNPRTGGVFQRPFAHSTIAEAMIIKASRHMTWRSFLNTTSGLTSNIRAVADGFIKNGYGDDTISLIVGDDTIG